MTIIRFQISLRTVVMATVAVVAATAASPQDEEMNSMCLLQTASQLAQHTYSHGAGTATATTAHNDTRAMVLIVIALLMVFFTLLLPWYLTIFGIYMKNVDIDRYRDDEDLHEALALMEGEDVLVRMADSKEFETSKLKTTLFDTYAIASGLLCSVAATTFFVDNRGPDEILNTSGDSVSLRYALRALYQMMIALSTSSGLYAFLVFVLCSQYSRGALCRSVGAVWLYFYVLEVTKLARQWAFFAMYVTSIMCVMALFLHAMSNNVFTSNHDLPRETIDVISITMGALILVILCVLFFQTQALMRKCRIIFHSDEEIKLIHDSLRSDQSKPRKPAT